MWFRSLVDALHPRVTRSRARRPRRGGARRRAVTVPWQIEALEARRLLTLAAAVHYPLVDSQAPSDIAAGDLNNDGLADLIAASGSGVQILLGSGSGAFDPAQATPVAAGLRSVAVADLNADGRLDVVATSSAWNGSANEGFINVLMNTGPDASGNATFETVRRFSTGSNTTPGALAVGDLNGDGRLDVAAAQAGGSNVTVLMGNGNGNLQSGRDVAVGSDPRSVAVGDINGDGRLDLATANGWSNTASVLLNNGNDAGGSATFQAASHTGIYGEAESVAVGDFNADGQLDLAVTSSVSYFGYYGGYYGAAGYVNVLLGNGDGSFASAKTTWVNNNRVGEVAAADFNGDGRLDVVTPDAFQAFTVDPTVLLGRGDGTFDPPYHFDAGFGPIAVVAADLNGDAAPDVGVANFFSASVSVLLNENDWPPVGAPLVSIGDVWISEGDTGTRNAVFTVSLSAAFHQPISIQYSTADGTATAGSDYQAKSGTLTFNPGGALSQTISVAVIGDRVLEPYSDSFHVNLSAGTNVRIVDGQGTGWITDDEPSAWVSSPQVVEGHTGTRNAVFTVSIGSSSEPLTVHWSTSDGTATAGSDYRASSGTLTFNAGGPLTQNVTIPVYGDRLGEGYEFFYLTLGNHYSGQGSILDDEPLFNINGASATEVSAGATSAVFTVSLSQPYDQPVSVNFSTAEGDTEFPGGHYYYYWWYPPLPAATSGSDFEGQTGTLTFAPGETSRQITVVVYDDRLAEPFEYFSVDLTNASANASFGDPHGLGSITDNEPVISINSAYVVEGNTGTTDAVFTVSLLQPYDEPVSVNFSTAEGDTEFPGGYSGYYGYYGPPPPATSGTDFQGRTGTLTFAPGETSREIRVAVIGDRHAEAQEHFSVDLTNPSANARLARSHGLGSIVDDEPLITISGSQVVEGNTGTTDALFTVSLEAASDGPVTIDWSTVDDYYWSGATAGSDYQASSGRVTFEVGGPLTQTIAVPVIGDRLFEYSESFYVALGNGYWWGSGTILDDEPLISISNAAVDEGDTGTTSAVFTVSLAHVYDEPVSVSFSTAEGPYYLPAATPGSDFQSRSGTVTIAAGQISTTINVAVNGDTSIEENEYFAVNLATPSANASISQGYAFGIIVDNDEPPTKFYVVDASSDKTFEYDATGAALENYSLRSGNNDPRGAASDASGERVWVIDNDDYVYVYDAAGNSLGSWKANGLKTPEGIASNGTDIWIVDRGSDRVYRFAGAASRTSGSASATGSFALNSGNREAKGIETDGTHLWVVNNNSTDKVFKYTLGGSLVGSWTLTGGVTNPTGITLDPSNPSDVWIVDASADTVFQYTAAAGRTSGSQAAAAAFNLASGNANPQGIADPPPAGTMAAVSAEPEAADFDGPSAASTRSRAVPAAVWAATADAPAHGVRAGRSSDETPRVLNGGPAVSAASSSPGATWGESVRTISVAAEKAEDANEPLPLRLVEACDAVFADTLGLGCLLDGPIR